jgi:hypothetical protein
MKLKGGRVILMAEPRQQRSLNVRYLLVLVIPFLAPFAISRHVDAQSSAPITVGAVSHGVRISLLIPRRSYPQDALVQFTVTLQNISQRDRYLQDWPPDWGGRYSPHILMRTAGGRLVYEEELSSFLAPTPGGFGSNYILRPGATLRRHIRFVLEAGQVQAVEKVFDGYTSFSSRPGTPTPPRSQWATHQWRVVTPFVPLTLTHEPAPVVAVSRTGGWVLLAARSRVAVSGSPLFMDSIRCWTGPSMMWTNQHVPWTPARGNRFSNSFERHCPSPQPWHAVIGWPNHRVAFISYADVGTIP